MLSSCYKPEFNCEIGVDEAGRGPMFGRLYVAGAVLPKDDSFDHSQMKDSKPVWTSCYNFVGQLFHICLWL